MKKVTIGGSTAMDRYPRGSQGPLDLRATFSLASGVRSLLNGWSTRLRSGAPGSEAADYRRGEMDRSATGADTEDLKNKTVPTLRARRNNKSDYWNFVLAAVS
jgi:hypothetical protein